MNKNLLVEYIPFKPIGPINEQMANKFGVPGGLVVQGVLQRAGAKNQNGRVYPKNILDREAKKYQQEYISQNRALGELDHPESSVVNLNNVSHNILDCWWNGDDVMGKVEILGTPSGNILKELLQAGILLGISSRGLGSVRELDEGTVAVEDDFELICWDFVSNPSTHGAFMNQVALQEGKVKVSKYSNLDSIINDILRS